MLVLLARKIIFAGFGGGGGGGGVLGLGRGGLGFRWLRKISAKKKIKSICERFISDSRISLRLIL